MSEITIQRPTMIRRGGYFRGMPLDRKANGISAAVPWWPTIQVWRREDRRRQLNLAWLFIWRGKVVFHLLDAWHLPSFKRVDRT